MVNITYDACKLPIHDPAYRQVIFFLAGDLSYFDPPSGTTFIYNLGDTAWTLASMALVWLMIPGLGFFYSGLLRRKNALSMIFTSMASIAVVSFQV
jgi:Amt family ammonium transporter